MIDANFPKDAEGRVYHLGLKKGEVANKILLVGDPERAKLIKEFFDDPSELFYHSTNRGFTTYTGTVNKKPVTVMSIGMGLPMMDFAVREIRAITEGPLDIIRLGTCGTPADIAIKTVVVANRSFGIMTDFNAAPEAKCPYIFTKLLEPDHELTDLLIKTLKSAANSCYPVVEATDATADFFYSSQGRNDPEFADNNDPLLDEALQKYPDTGSLQMETYHLFYLAERNKVAKKEQMIRVASCAIVLAQRKTGAFLTNEEKHQVEKSAGKACLEVLALRA